MTLFLQVDPPDAVQIPEELQAALESDPRAQAEWARLTPGRRRTLAYSVERGKRPETRRRRAGAVVDELLLDAGVDPDGN